MRYIDYVDTEGGPFLIADGGIVQSWRGSDDGSLDYDRACDILLPAKEGSLLSVDAGQALIWETDGPGTGDVYQINENQWLILRAWLNEDTQIAIDALAQSPLINPEDFGVIEITSEVLAILWAPESGSCILDLNVLDNERPMGEMATGSGGLLIKVKNGIYRCFGDKVAVNDDTARRCHLVRLHV
ncbi:hypothetical protein CCAX7_10860 [Capsulimonas corticalis]|uniref:Uncharacterized protein n=1 Tax=Capsulimonas corticalis TaxID=2219043 RepID=A0A402CUN3_9BACT|nr:hypothetical protein [Capsulimonas corticalis]BDI29035.1 hypothetical protein CCAX7_10860 [Capsulimonas corticalis]